MVSALYRVAVCEDEAILCANLCAQCESILDKLKVEHRITSFSSAEKLENALLAGEEFSLLCLDILMGGKSGMKLAQELRQRDDKTSILFITSSTEFLKDGYSVRPIQYLLKPVQAAELEQAITTDLRLYHRPSTVTFHAGGKTLVIPTEDIYYAESREHGTVLHMTHGEKFLPLSLSQTEKILPGSLFCRCHNSFLVNLSHICEEGGRTLYLTDGSDLAIGRRYMEHGQDGQNGQDGKDGQDGAAGRGIDNAMIDNDGYLILTMTDGTTINAGLVRDTSAVANKEANDSATAKSLATAAVGLSGASLLWNIAMLALSITMKRKKTTFHR